MKVKVTKLCEFELVREQRRRLLTSTEMKHMWTAGRNQPPFDVTEWRVASPSDSSPLPPTRRLSLVASPSDSSPLPPTRRLSLRLVASPSDSSPLPPTRRLSLRLVASPSDSSPLPRTRRLSLGLVASPSDSSPLPPTRRLSLRLVASPSDSSPLPPTRRLSLGLVASPSDSSPLPPTRRLSLGLHPTPRISRLPSRVQLLRTRTKYSKIGPLLTFRVQINVKTLPHNYWIPIYGGDKCGDTRTVHWSMWAEVRDDNRTGLCVALIGSS